MNGAEDPAGARVDALDRLHKTGRHYAEIEARQEFRRRFNRYVTAITSGHQAKVARAKEALLEAGRPLATQRRAAR